MLLGGCARGPDEQAIRAEVQEKLAHQLKTGLFDLAALKRRGSSLLPAADNGAKRLIVYFNATLRFAQDYDFGGWEELSPASLAYVLGATEKGLVGLKPGNRIGDELYVYGSSTYEQSGDGWKGVVSAADGTTTPPDLGNTAPPLRSKQLIDKLAAMVNLPPPGVGPAEETVISEELDRAAENIQRRLQRRKHVFTVASGPPGGHYTRFGSALVEGVAKAGVKVAVRNRETAGSVQNARLLMRGEADYAIIQSDVAARAFAGEGPFAPAPLNTLRALGGLFPEAIQIVVPSASPIQEVTDLRGKRVDIGLSDSGTQYDATAVLEAHGLRAGDLAEARQDGAEKAMQRLKEGKIDGFFVTMAAPARALQDLAARQKIRLLSLQDRVIERLIAQHPGLVPITLPANTYPGQVQDVRTVATVALLVTESETPDAEVENVTELVYGVMNFLRSGSVEGARVAASTAQRGLTIPMHPGASRYFGRAGPR
jgi:TRAP transporter TAXI family solute receptor